MAAAPTRTTSTRSSTCSTRRAEFAGATPGGPLSLPPGGRHWYAIRAIGYPDPDTFKATYAQVADWLDALPEKTGVPLERTVLGGFSQGTVMSYALGLGKGRPRPAGILAMSGFIPTVEGWELDLAKAEGLPVLIAHGSHDPVIGVEWGRDAKEQLDAAGALVTYLESPMPHTIDPRSIPGIAEWLHATLGSHTSAV